MVVVADTGPLNYLILIEAVDVLLPLFENVVIPSAVLNELLAPRTPLKVRQWIENMPRWIQVRAPESISPMNLGRGELEAIALAQELHADVLMMDDLTGRIAAERLGLALVGTTGVLERAAAMRLIDLEDAFARLRKTTFRASREIFAAALERDRARKNKNEKAAE